MIWWGRLHGEMTSVLEIVMSSNSSPATFTFEEVVISLSLTHLHLQL